MTLIGDVDTLRRWLENYQFQSLFSWMTLIGLEGISRGPTPEEVSILVFLDDAHRHLRSNRMPWSPSSFNPCFLG